MVKLCKILSKKLNLLFYVHLVKIMKLLSQSCEFVNIVVKYYVKQGISQTTLIALQHMFWFYKSIFLNAKNSVF